jgi:hypothetical protein
MLPSLVVTDRGLLAEAVTTVGGSEVTVAGSAVMLTPDAQPVRNTVNRK